MTTTTTTTTMDDTQVPRHARLFDPVASHHASRSSAELNAPLTWFRKHGRWSGKANVNASQVFHAALDKRLDDLLLAVGYGPGETNEKLRATLVNFSSDFEHKDEGNLLANPATMDPRFGMTYVYPPSCLVLRLDNVSGELRIERPGEARILVGERVRETASTSTHTLQMLEPILCVRSEYRDINAAPATQLETYNERYSVEYSVQKYAVPETPAPESSPAISSPRYVKPPERDQWDRPADSTAVADAAAFNKNALAEEHPTNATVASLLSSSGTTLHVRHHTEANGALDVTVSGNVGYTITFNKASALVYIQIKPHVTRVAMKNMTGARVELRTGVSSDAARVNYYIAYNPIAALTTTEGVQAMARALGVARNGPQDASGAVVLSELHPIAALAKREADLRAKVAEQLWFNTKCGFVFFKHDQLFLRTNDNIYYTVFLAPRDMLGSLPLFCLKRTSDRARTLNPNLPPLRLVHVLDSAKASELIVRTVLPGATARTLSERLRMLFGFLVDSYDLPVPVSEVRASNTLEILRELGCPIPATGSALGESSAAISAPVPSIGLGSSGPIAAPPVLSDSSARIPSTPVPPALSESSSSAIIAPVTPATVAPSFVETLAAIEKTTTDNHLQQQQQQRPVSPIPIERRSTRVNLSIFAGLRIAGRPIDIKPSARPVPITSDAEVPVPAPAPAPEAVSLPEPEPEPVPEPAPAPVAEPMPEPVPEPAPAPAPETVPEATNKKRPREEEQQPAEDAALRPPPSKKQRRSKSDTTVTFQRPSKRTHVPVSMRPPPLVSDIDFSAMQKLVMDHSQPIPNMPMIVLPPTNDPTYAFNMQQQQQQPQEPFQGMMMPDTLTDFDFGFSDPGLHDSFGLAFDNASHDNYYHDNNNNNNDNNNNNNMDNY
jgi:hypothetical protein